MKIFLNLFFILISLIFINKDAVSQVSNDSCLSANNLGFIPFGSIGTFCFDGQINIPLIDSTDLALPNFPYPNIILPCNGYIPSIAVPGKDLWYTFYTNCDLTFRAENSDTVHLSFWIGDDCNNLLPIDCFTIPEGISFSQTLNGLGGHAIFLQVSGPNTIVNTNFTVCFSGTIGACFPVFNFSPTPVQCFTYEVQITDCSNSQSNDGSVNINSMLGNSPYTCYWNDGVIGFSRNNLAPGVYYFTITDVNGCAENDSIVISISTSLIENKNNDFLILNDTKVKEITISSSNNYFNVNNYYNIKNTLGHLIYTDRITSDIKFVFNYSSFAAGIYFLQFEFQNSIKSIKFQVLD